MKAALLQTRMLHAFVRWVASSSASSDLLELPGVTAAVVPSVPGHSIPNSVVYDAPGHLADAYPELEERFARAGVRAWTVWVPDSDAGTRSFLEERGHAFDGEPAAMMIELAGFEAPDLAGFDWDAEATAAELAEINDLAYGFVAPDSMGAAFRKAARTDEVRFYRARVDGVVAAVLGTIDVGTDAGIVFVATPPEMRGRGLAGRLLAAALTEARERGMVTSSLQASALGYPVYEGLGYGMHYRFNLLERRKAVAE